MKKQYLSTQDIFNRVFVNADSALKASLGLHSAQDYINAVYAPEGDALRIRLAGGMLPAVTSVADLPASAEAGTICPVVTVGGEMAFYRWEGEETGWTLLNAGGGGAALTEEQTAALEWVAENLERLQAAAAARFVEESVFELYAGESPYALLAGTSTRLGVSDAGDTDGDGDTLYRLDIAGYVLDVETYAAGATLPDRYYTKIVYEAGAGAAGISHIYLEAAEYAEFAERESPYNTLRLHYTAGPFGGAAVERVTLEIPAAGVAALDGALSFEPDTEDTDGEAATLWKAEIPGYVLNVEAFPDENAALAARYPAKMHYDAERDTTLLYLDAEEYDTLAALGAGRNLIYAYRLAAPRRTANG